MVQREAEVGEFESQQQPPFRGHPPSFLNLLSGKPRAESAGPPAASEGLERGMALHRKNYTQILTENETRARPTDGYPQEGRPPSTSPPPLRRQGPDPFVVRGFPVGHARMESATGKLLSYPVMPQSCGGDRRSRTFPGVRNSSAIFHNLTSDLIGSERITWAVAVRSR